MEQSTDIQVLPEQQFLAGVDPSTERQANLAQAIQSLGERGVPLFGSFTDPRAASRFAGQITGGLETLGDFLPGISTQLAQERDDAVGEALSYLDLIPAAPLAKPAVKKGIKTLKKFSGPDTKKIFEGIKGVTFRERGKAFENPIPDIVAKRPDLLSKSKEVLDPENKGIVSLYRVYNLKEGDELMPEKGIASLTTDLGAALKIGDEMKSLTFGDPLFDPKSVTLDRPALVARYDVPIDRVKAHVPTVADAIPKNMAQAEKNYPLMRAMIKEEEVIADIGGIAPATTFAVPFNKRYYGDYADLVDLDMYSIRGRGAPRIGLNAYAAFDRGQTPRDIIAETLRVQRKLPKKFQSYYTKQFFDEGKSLKEIPVIVEAKQILDDMYQEYGKLAGKEIPAPKGLPSLGGQFLTKDVFPAPQKFLDPSNPAFKENLSEFADEGAGKFLQMGDKIKDITGSKPTRAQIQIDPAGKSSFKISDATVDELPESTGKTIKANLFKKRAGWKWTKTPEGYSKEPASDFPLISLETGNKHFYALKTDFETPVELKRFKSKTEPRLRPTTKGTLEKGKVVGEISVRGKKHPVYEKIIVFSERPRKPITGVTLGARQGRMPKDKSNIKFGSVTVSK